MGGRISIWTFHTWIRFPHTKQFFVNFFLFETLKKCSVKYFPLLLPQVEKMFVKWKLKKHCDLTPPFLVDTIQFKSHHTHSFSRPTHLAKFATWFYNMSCKGSNSNFFLSLPNLRRWYISSFLSSRSSHAPPIHLILFMKYIMQCEKACYKSVCAVFYYNMQILQ